MPTDADATLQPISQVQDRVVKHATLKSACTRKHWAETPEGRARDKWGHQGTSRRNRGCPGATQQ